MTQKKFCRVLVVDDNRDTADSMFMILRTDGHFEPYAAYSAAVGMAMVHSHRPDIILLDLRMPDMDGFQMGCRIKELLPSCKIIIVSGHGTEEDKSKCIAAGFDGHFTKPADPKQLLDLIYRYLDPAE